jgi:hypothetical protein
MDRVRSADLILRTCVLKSAAFNSLNEKQGFAQLRHADSSITFARNELLEPVDATIALWIKSLGWDAPTATALAAKRAQSNTGYFLFVLTLPKTIHFDWGGVSHRWNTGYQPPVNKWVHICLTRESAIRKLFINGYRVAETSDPGDSSVVPADVDLVFGKNGASGGYQFKGDMAGFLFWNRALTDDEARRVYEGAVIRNGLNVFCPFRSDARDVSGKDNHGLLQSVTFKRK